METTQSTQLEQYRQALYASFDHAADATFELLDALASQSVARSVAELSLESVFRRGYSSLYDAITGFHKDREGSERAQTRRQQEVAQMHLLASYVPAPEKRPYWLFATDATSNRRQFARTLQDRGYVYWPNSVAGNKPVTIGHSYSVLVALPEKAVGDPPWVVPLLNRRITTAETETEVAAAHLKSVFGDETLPWHGQLTVQILDSKHSTSAYLHSAAQHENHVTITRVRGNRVLYRQYQSPPGERKPGKPRSYGERFALREPETWHVPDDQFETNYTSKRGRVYTVKIQAWHNMLMRGKRAYPMHERPFTLVQVVWYDEHGEPIHKKPLWLLVFGQRRQELTLEQVNAAYRQRFDQEHFFRFGKQRLLLATYQTPEAEHEENWWQLVMRAYVMLFLARHLSEQLPRPWERYLPQPKNGLASPAAVQRGFGRIIRAFGTPARSPKPRKNSPGRAKGTPGKRRKRWPVVKKG
ncbi:MAG: transposase [Anaerolineales bacterium]|nr:transposase [Chloroflexota bacterium]MBL7162740.1 transposase [Anaerolineales bacterium]